MSFFDWNGDGGNDFTDDFLEYHIFKECMKDFDDDDDLGIDDYDDLGSTYKSIYDSRTPLKKDYSNNQDIDNKGCAFAIVMIIYLFIACMILK